MPSPQLPYLLPLTTKVLRCDGSGPLLVVDVVAALGSRGLLGSATISCLWSGAEARRMGGDVKGDLGRGGGLHYETAKARVDKVQSAAQE